MKIGERQFKKPEFEVEITLNDLEIKEICDAFEQLSFYSKRPIDKFSEHKKTIYDGLKFTLEK